ncbi:MAG: DUF502 domain-containing protein [Gammaproteobacteria bacterium]|uniref:DUF502 domain-containing protein n=1 Tax=Rhodoferax sp. TaxID=50421 RepID=UPI00179FCB7D|nr:DUF502 domain-containing protein [Rhodoferax sp.]MBU3897411.1 DUF502 domain-containing protein [Gammaproteobacteria bacterium]MBA3057129.1 DUF502 domain-containing protein [Rhodoferax sp.]MBU3999290.1 DUF502 domain-containing protein [Gammaproteobacteria bacterium]MBU4018757.1 DUF502 domain-containing protein [Gammaproteobacteria bacterium]MBU4079712.1 DUF502 domain-containing protein [Gammaproteobacteria bacterium]
MKPLYQYFFRGLFAILPVGLTVYVLFLIASWIDAIAMSVVRPLIGDFYLPGLGIALGVGLIIGIGFVISQPQAARLMPWVELPFTNVPVVKSIYSSLKNFADFFSTQKKDSQQVVVLRKPGQDLSIVGLVTRQSMQGLPQGLALDNQVAVYLPMGYMIGGYTVFVPRSWIEPIEMSVEEAMRSTLIAWMAAKPADAPSTPD